MDTHAIQSTQEAYDKDYRQHNASELEKIRHITLHMTKLLGKLGAYCERQEHGEPATTDQIQTEVIPDMLVYTAQLGNLLGVDIGEAYTQRIEENIKKFSSH